MYRLHVYRNTHKHTYNTHHPSIHPSVHSCIYAFMPHACIHTCIQYNTYTACMPDAYMHVHMYTYILLLSELPVRGEAAYKEEEAASP